MASRRPQDPQVEALCLLGGIDPEFLGEQLSAPLVHPEGLGPIPRGGVGPHQGAIGRLPDGSSPSASSASATASPALHAGPTGRRGPPVSAGGPPAGEPAAGPPTGLAPPATAAERRWPEPPGPSRTPHPPARPGPTSRPGAAHRPRPQDPPRSRGQSEPVHAERPAQRIPVEPDAGQGTSELAHHRPQGRFPDLQAASRRPELLSQLLPSQGPLALGRQQGEHHPPLEPGQRALLHDPTIGLEGDPAGQEHPQRHAPLKVTANGPPTTSQPRAVVSPPWRC
jgi:hypothetical protein